MFNLTLDPVLEVSLIITILGLIVFYFGRLIADTKVERYNKMDYYFQGLFFSVFYLYLPLIVSYFIKDYFNLLGVITLIIHVIILGILSSNLKANNLIRRNILLKEFKKRLKAEFEKRKKEDNLSGKILKNVESDSLVSTNIFFHYEIPISWFGNRKFLFTLSIIMILSFASIRTFDIFYFISFATLFLGLTSIALAYGFGNNPYSINYPKAEILLDNGDKISGNIIKHGDFVHIIKDNKKTFINKDKIVKIDEDVLVNKK